MNLFRLIVLVILLSSWLVANVRDNIRLENYIQRQIESYLSRVLPGNSYLVTVSVDAEYVRTQELKNETVDSYIKEENVTPPTPPAPPVPDSTSQNEDLTFGILPGLERIVDSDRQNKIERSPQIVTRSPQIVTVPSQEPARNFREEQNKTSRDYDYNNQLDIREVSVQIAFDDSLTPALVQSVKNLISSKMDTTFGDRATVIYSTVDLDQVRGPNPEQGSFPSQYSPLQSEPLQNNNNYPPPNSQENNQNINVDIPGRAWGVLDQENFVSNTGFDYYFEKYSSIIYILMSVIVFIILFLLFFFFLWLFMRMLGRNEKKEESPPPPPPPPPPTYPQEPAIPVTLGKQIHSEKIEPPSYRLDIDSVGVKNKEEKFLEQFLREPLLSRKYFLNLSEEDKNELLSALLSNATKAVFHDIANDSSLGQDSLFKKDINPSELEKIRENIFNKHIEGINQYNKIYASQMRDPFSQLSFFMEDEMKTFFNSISINSAVIIAKNVDSQKMVPYLNQLSENKKKEFLRLFNSEQEITRGELEAFKKELKTKIDDLSKNIFIRKVDNKFIKRKLLESSSDKKKFLESIKSDDPDFYNEYRGYMVDFNDFMADESSVFSQTLHASENEDITFALIGIKSLEMRNKFLNALPEIRRNFVSSLVTSRQSSATRQDIENSQNNILDIYRSHLI